MVIFEIFVMGTSKMRLWDLFLEIGCSRDGENSVEQRIKFLHISNKLFRLISTRKRQEIRSKRFFFLRTCDTDYILVLCLLTTFYKFLWSKAHKTQVYLNTVTRSCAMSLTCTSEVFFWIYITMIMIYRIDVAYLNNVYKTIWVATKKNNFDFGPG